jgi:hypothetical protein
VGLSAGPSARPAAWALEPIDPRHLEVVPMPEKVTKDKVLV